MPHTGEVSKEGKKANAVRNNPRQNVHQSTAVIKTSPPALPMTAKPDTIEMRKGETGPAIGTAHKFIHQAPHNENANMGTHEPHVRAGFHAQHDTFGRK